MLFARTLVPVVALVVAGCSGSSPEDIFEDGGSSESGGGSTGDGGASSTSQTGQGSTTGTGPGSGATTGPGGTSTTGPGGTGSSTVTTGPGGGDVCGDLLCGATESCGTCPADCVCAECGDGTCAAPETCEVCPTDCGACTSICGDLVCEGDEVGTCPQDCGGPGASTGTGGLGNCPPDPCEVGGSYDQTCQDPCVLIACTFDATCCEGTWSEACVATASLFCTCT